MSPKDVSAVLLAAALTPLLLIYLSLAFALAVMMTCLILPRLLLAQKLYWCACACLLPYDCRPSLLAPCAKPTYEVVPCACRCCPFIPHIWQAQGPVKGNCLRLAFETTYSINVLRRLLTLPIRSHLPDFYIVGFPVSSLYKPIILLSNSAAMCCLLFAIAMVQKAGTTSLANCLKLHPAISGMDGLPWHEALSKESHYFNGVFGPAHASSAVLYSSFFPTVLCRWWAEHVRGVKKVHLLPHLSVRATHSCKCNVQDGKVSTIAPDVI